jgi:hypothetical protein
MSTLQDRFGQNARWLALPSCISCALFAATVHRSSLLSAVRERERRPAEDTGGPDESSDRASKYPWLTDSYSCRMPSGKSVAKHIQASPL